MRDLLLILFHLLGGDVSGEVHDKPPPVSPFPQAELIEIARPQSSAMGQTEQAQGTVQPESLAQQEQEEEPGRDGREWQPVAGEEYSAESNDLRGYEDAAMEVAEDFSPVENSSPVAEGVPEAAAADPIRVAEKEALKAMEEEYPWPGQEAHPAPPAKSDTPASRNEDRLAREELEQVNEIRSLFAEKNQSGNYFDFGLHAGLRRDFLQWNIASDMSGQATPNVLSELTWKDLRIAEVHADAKFSHASGLSLEASASYGRVLKGDNQDSDYIGNNRTLEFSRSSNNGGKDGDARSVSVALGWRFAESEQQDSWANLLVGYSRHDLALSITDGKQMIPAVGRFPFLRSSYNATWQGPWAGIEFVDEGQEYLNGKLRFEYHLPKYEAWANWNLRPEFRHPKSFEHRADGRGYIVSLDLFSPRERGPWSYNAGVEYQYWKSEDGIDRTFFNDFPASETRLNVVKRHSWGISFGMEYRFGEQPSRWKGIHLAADNYLSSEDLEVEEIRKLFGNGHRGNRLDLAMDAGMRRDDFRWNIGYGKGYPADHPDVLSELTWRKMNIAEIRARANFQHDSGVSIEGQAAYGRILSGKNQDSDYLGDGRTLEFSRSHADTDGNTRSGSVALGLRLAGSDQGNAWWTGLVGYSKHEMRLTDTHGKQVIPVSQPFAGLHSTYNAKWQGPWIGLQFTDEETEGVNGRLRLEYHWARYDGWANWNLRTDFQHPKSFEHEADGKGYILSLDLYSPPDKLPWSYRIGLEYQHWKTDQGIDRTFFSDSTVGEIDLNEVKWRSFGLHFGLEYKF